MSRDCVECIGALGDVLSTVGALREYPKQCRRFEVFCC